MLAAAAAKPTASSSTGKKYTLAELRNRPRELDDKKLESYLSDSDFKAAFKVDKADFNRLPNWKQEEMKKKLGLCASSLLLLVSSPFADFPLLD